MDYSDKISEITSSKAKFNETVYTPLAEAVRLVKERQNNFEIEEVLKTYFKFGIPEPLKDGPRVVIARHLITPNYEIRRFMCVPDATNISPLLLEHDQDKFTAENKLKYYLGKLAFHHGIGKKGGHKISYKTIIDFNKNNGKKIKEVITYNNQTLPEFHHSLLKKVYVGHEDYLYNISDWYYSHGKTAREYYKNYMALFVKNAILFENFILGGDESPLIKEIFLPAFLEVWDKTGEKPLIVALEPTEVEGDLFWMCYPGETIDHLDFI